MSERSHRAGWRMGATALLLVTAFLLPASVPAQEPTAETAQAFQRLRATYGDATTTAVRELVAEAEARGVPGVPILDKALEGLAKDVPADRLLPVLRSYRDRLGRAGEILGGQGGTSLLVAAADALQRGVPEGVVRDVTASNAAEAPVALIVVGDLVESGVAPEQAARVVGAALQRNQAGQQLLDISAAVRQLIRGGQLPEQAARAVRDAIQKGRPPGSLPGVGSLPGAAGGPPGGDPPGPPECCSRP